MIGKVFPRSYPLKSQIFSGLWENPVKTKRSKRGFERSEIDENFQRSIWVEESNKDVISGLERPLAAQVDIPAL
jgi:hypothetical protein